MNEYGPTHNEIDDYITELTEIEREELATADAAIELAFLFHDAREARGLTQAEAARQTGLRQQAVSRFEQPGMKLAKTKLETLRKYLTALGYKVGLSISDSISGVLVKEISFEPSHYVGFPAPSQPESYSGHVFDTRSEGIPRTCTEIEQAQIGTVAEDNFSYFGDKNASTWRSFVKSGIGDINDFTISVDHFRNAAFPLCQSQSIIASKEGLGVVVTGNERSGNVKRKTAA